MKARLLLLLLFIAGVCAAWAQGPNDSGTYYQNADGKKGAALKTALCGVIYAREEGGDLSTAYKALWTHFRTTDAKPNGKVWDMYSNKREMEFGTDQDTGSGNQEGQYYNREHSFPNSWFGGKVMPMYTDLYHMYPTDKIVNNKRANFPFGETANPNWKSANDFSKLGPCSVEGYTGTVFEPNDEYKGDFARTYFYMVTCYEEKLPDWYTTYPESQPTLDGNTYPGLSEWQLKMLMKWAKNDPVSEKEINRNNAVYGIQQNRNPFIDYPGLEEYIWGDKQDVAFSYDNYEDPTIISADDSGSCGENLTWTYVENIQTLTISGTGPMYDFSPSNSPWYQYRTNIRTVNMNEGITSIGRNALRDCSELTSVAIPNSIITIGYGAFYNCRCLTSLTVPNSVTNIGAYVFYGCSGLTSVSISNSVREIEECTFYSCSDLISIDIPDNVTSIGTYAFWGCSALTSVTIPNSMKTIGYGAFQSCSSLTSVTIPNNLTILGDYAFSLCSGLTSVTISNGVKTIGNYTFQSCYGLTSISIPNSVITIGEGAFQSCQNLEILKLPDELQIIKKAAFKWCRVLKSITIPSTVEYIYSEAFSGCDALESIKALPETPPFLYDNSFTNYSVPLIVPNGCKEAYQNAQGWKNFTNISDNKYQLTYLVDGEEYKSYIIEYGTPITPEAEPTKETYKFSGWSNIPETMPNHDVTVTGTFARYFDVGNLTKAIDFVMNSSASAEDVSLYDLNNNKKMDVGDVILIVKFILSNINNTPNFISRRAGEVACLCQYTAAQFEVKTTGNVDIRLVKSMEQTHQLMYQQKDANTYAVVVYSLSNQLMRPENGKIIETDNFSDILSIENVTVATPTSETAYYQTLSTTTGIEQIENENGTAVIYDLKGNRLNSGKALNKGIYIVNGKKSIMK